MPVGSPLLSRTISPPGGLRRVLGVADHAQGGAVEQGAIVEVEDEHRGVRRGLVQLLQGRHALLGELELVPAADHPHPLRRGRACGLVLEHAQGVGQRGHAFPAQLQVVVEAAADQVQVRVVQAGDHGALLEVDHPGGAAGQLDDLRIGAHGHHDAVAQRDGGGLGPGRIHRGDAAVAQDELGRAARSRLREHRSGHDAQPERGGGLHEIAAVALRRVLAALADQVGEHGVSCRMNPPILRLNAGSGFSQSGDTHAGEPPITADPASPPATPAA